MLPMGSYYGMERERDAVRSNESDAQKAVDALAPIADRLRALGFAIVLVGPSAMNGVNAKRIEEALEAKVDGIVNELTGTK